MNLAIATVTTARIAIITTITITRSIRSEIIQNGASKYKK
jgi:hypothetical protein